MNRPRARVEEVVSVLTPADGVSIDQMLADAALALPAGAVLTRDDENNRVIVTWYKRG